MIKPLEVPVIPNSPLSKKNKKMNLGKILLRKNKSTGFIENSLFQVKKIKYDDNYQNDQSNSLQFKNQTDYDAHLDALGNQIDNAKDGKDIEVSLEGLNIAPSNLVQLDNDITNGEDSDDSDDDDGELVVEDVTNEQES